MLSATEHELLNMNLLCFRVSCRWLAVGSQLLQRPFYSDQVLSALALSPGEACYNLLCNTSTALPREPAAA